MARTCTACGELADGASFPLLNRGLKNEAHRKTCHDCTNAKKKQDREQRGIGLPTPRPPENLQTARWQRWTKEDDLRLRQGIAAEESYEDIAVALGRSLRSVYKRREILGIAQVRKKHRVEKPWRIR